MASETTLTVVAERRAVTKTAARAVNSRIRALQRERRAVLDGRYLPWGMPGCVGPASPYHQAPVCEGCCAAAVLRDAAAVIAARILELQAQLAPAVGQGALW